ncbi:MAG TPA: sugar phosphate isomerase/epimerase family protein [Micromonosporaceae bacterium]
MIDTNPAKLPLAERISCQERLLPGDSLEQKWEVAQQAGLTGIELRCPDGRSFDDRRGELWRAAAAGVVMPTACVDVVHLDTSDGQQLHEAIRHVCSQLCAVAAVGAEVVIMPISNGEPRRGGSPVEESEGSPEHRGMVLEALAELAEQAQREGVVLGLEPVNRYENQLINTLADAVAVCEQIGLPSVRVAADTYHMNIEEADPAGALLTAAPWLGHVQLSDSNRLEPGRGHLDWSLLLGTLNAVGYPGWLALECQLSGAATDTLPRAVSILRGAAL